jgi:ribosomal protein S27AE
MNKIPDCPRCGEDELWFLADLPNYFRLRCHLCGYDSGPCKPRDDMDLDGSIATVVELERVAAVKRAMQGGAR